MTSVQIYLLIAIGDGGDDGEVGDKVGGCRWGSIHFKFLKNNSIHDYMLALCIRIEVNMNIIFNILQFNT